MGLLSKILGDPNKKIIEDLEKIVKEINDLESKFKNMSDDDLKNYSNDLQQKSLDTDINELIADSYALVRESSKRIIGLRHYDVQLMGGIVLHQGKISEMKTGEGKTLVATLPTFLNSLGNKLIGDPLANNSLQKQPLIEKIVLELETSSTSFSICSKSFSILDLIVLISSWFLVITIISLGDIQAK